MPKQQKTSILIITGICMLIVVTALFVLKDKITLWYISMEQQQLQQTKPEEHNWNDNTNTSSASGNLIPPIIPEKYDLTMEFHSQAPLAIWDDIHEELCEESSILLVINYFLNRSMTNKMFDTELLAMKQAEESILGVWKSTTVAELKQFIEAYFPNFSVQMIDHITQTQIEEYIASHIPVLIPVSGQTIGNPFYKAPGPVYHIIVIKGYTKTHFITHDVGTKRGKDYFYTKDILMKNIHDWNPIDIKQGEQRAFIIRPS